MVRKTILFKRKLNGWLPVFLFLVLLFLGVFGACMGGWFLLHGQTHVQSPLAKMVLGKNTYTISTRIQSLCVSTHINCATIAVENNGTATITIDTDEQVILSLQKDLSKQFASLQLTIGHLTIEGKRFHRLDFRFDNPVISY